MTVNPPEFRGPVRSNKPFFENSNQSRSLRIVALRWEKKQILETSLPEAFHALGANCIQNSRHLNLVPYLTTQLRSTIEEIKVLQEEAFKNQYQEEMLLFLYEQRNTLVAKIGFEIYKIIENKSGPEPIVKQIEILNKRKIEIDYQINQQLDSNTEIQLEAPDLTNAKTTNTTLIRKSPKERSSCKKKSSYELVKAFKRRRKQRKTIQIIVWSGLIGVLVITLLLLNTVGN
jgi:hypothetical protein